MPLFGKKRAEMPAPGEGTPTDLVLRMRAQGLSNNQIIATLQREGYSSTQIFDAMSQADIKGAIAPMPQMPEEPLAMPQQAPMPAPTPEYAPAPQPVVAEIPKEQLEEVAESIIEEKWNELMKAVDKIILWKDNVEKRVAKMEQGIEDLKKNFEQLQSGVLGKVADYDKGIRDLGVEIRTMGEVFKKVLPSFTENISELSRIVKVMKGKKLN